MEKTICVKLTKNEWRKVNSVIMAAVLTLATGGDIHEGAELSKIGLKLTRQLEDNEE